MPITVTMPALSPTMSEGTLARWLVKEGDTVSAGDAIAEIETDKATMEVEAADDGIVGSILVPGGTEGVAVNSPIAVLLEEGEDRSALAGYEPRPVGGAAGTSAAATGATLPPVSAAPPIAAAPQAATAPIPVETPKAAARIFASPLARRLAAEAGLELQSVRGSGPHGRIVKADVEAALAQPRAPAEPVAATVPPTTEAPAPAGGSPYIEIPHTNMRRTIARRLTEAKQSIPHFYLTIDCRIDALLGMRKDLNAKSDDYKISVNDFIVRASALALRKVPAANACWTDTALRRYETVDVSVAVALDDGLITPIIRNADHKGLAAISGEMRDLAARAREGKLMPEEYQGGTFSISNLGMYGIREFAAVINPPQGAILAIGAGEQRPVVENDALAVATVMSCTLSCDHRVVDGAIGSQFLAAFKGFIEDPLTMLL